MPVAGQAEGGKWHLGVIRLRAQGMSPRILKYGSLVLEMQPTWRACGPRLAGVSLWAPTGDIAIGWVSHRQAYVSPPCEGPGSQCGRCWGHTGSMARVLPAGPFAKAHEGTFLVSLRWNEFN